ncbi:lipopolysaccharide biosynthesis protein [Deinococcus knuensis]|uniref:lipopolysaccharide biosynthesis protein n=1 Tax=Deinococcus knuensis TaxID=1837380 RepID=UPI0016670D3D|nr:hypothetical protein [Deinococcus knuensis]
MIIQILGIFSGIIIARGLSPSGRGAMAVIVTLPTVLSYALEFGLPISYMRFSNALNRRFLITSISVFSLCILASSLFLAYLATSFIPSYSAHKYAILTFCIFFVPVSLSTRLFQSFLLGTSNFKHSESIRLSVPLLNVLMLSACLFFDSISVVSVILITLLSNVVALCLSLFFSVKYKNTDLKEGVGFLGLVSYGIKSHFSRLSIFSNLRGELLYLTSVASSYSIGYYVIALSIAGIPRSLAANFGNYIYLVISKIGNTEQMAKLFTSNFYRIFTVVIIACICCAAGMNTAVNLVYGYEYRESVYPAVLLTIGGLFFILYQFVTDGMRAFSDNYMLSRAEIISTSCGFLSILVLNIININHIALIIMLSQVLSALIQIIYAFRKGCLKI